MTQPKHQAATDEQIIYDSVEESKDYRRRWLLVGIVTIAVLSLLVSGIAAYYAYGSVKDQAAAGTTLAQQVKDACEDPTKRTADIQYLCDNAEKVVEEAPEAIKGDTGPQGEQGEPGPPPSAAQVAKAVASFCAGQRCRGTDGKNATQSQVAQAVQTYCNARGECEGPQGDTGNVGDTGPIGPPPSDAQVQDAVDAYCLTHNGCQGPAGPEGPPGPTGVVNVDDQCEAAAEGMVVADVNSTYDPDTRTLTIDCTYKEDAAVPPGTGGETP